MIGAAEIAEIGVRLAARAGSAPPPAWDLRIDAEGLQAPDALLHAKHQALLRAYQSRYVLLPRAAPDGSVLERLRRHYDAEETARLDALKRTLERELLAPLADAARRSVDVSLGDYVERLIPEIRSRPETPFVAWLRGNPNREAHYRNFLIQSSADLLAEASASALGVVGEFGAPQSALFRILIDEFGYGAHGKKHAVFYQAVMRGFGLCDEYNAYWPLFDTPALELHNAIHFLFQNPANVFLQVGFLLYAETAYQRSTADHFRYLREFHPDVDARYFGEHAHIDLHHTRMVAEEVAAPLVQTFGTEAGAEIVAGAEFTRAAFDAAGEALLAVSQAFEDAGGRPAAPDLSALGRAVTPQTAGAAPVQVGGLGVVDGPTFAGFPAGAFGREA